MQERFLVIIPSFNERENIAELIDRILSLYQKADVLVVDDGSPDGTGTVIKQAQQKHGNRLALIERTGKGGRGSAVLRGFSHALEHGEYDVVFEMDADFSHKPEEIELLLEKISDADVVIGSRYLPKSEIHEWGMKRRVFSKFANKFAKTILRIPISDYTNGFRAYRMDTVRALDHGKITAKGYVVLSQVAFQLHKQGKTFADVPTVFVNRRRGVSNLSFKEIYEAFSSVVAIRWPRGLKHFEQLVKFGITGGFASIIDLGSLALFVEVFGMNEYAALVASSMLALIFVFLINKYFTFRNKDTTFMQQVIKFSMVYGVAVVLNMIVSSALLAMGMYYILAKVIAILSIALWNYVWLHVFVFAHKK